MKIMERIKEGIRTWLQINPPAGNVFTINEYMTFEANVIKNRMWYVGNPDELSQFYQQLYGEVNRTRFWAARATPGREFRKIHCGIPMIIVDTRVNIILTDLNEIEIPDKYKKDWQQIDKENRFKHLLSHAVKDTLFLGDGAFKISFDEKISDYPIIEWYPADRVELVYQRGRLKEVVFKTPYQAGSRKWILHERYGYGYITYELRTLEGKKADFPEGRNLPEFPELSGVIFDPSFIMAVPFRIYESAKWEERGKSIYDGKEDEFDALDEAWSQWMQAIRDGRSTRYIPESFLPRNPDTGMVLKPNPFDNAYIQTDSDAGGNARNEIKVVQPEIPSDHYMTTYITALDLCLQGIISPSTIGIDVKKLDNAEAQREKEKTTLYTRGNIIDALQDTVPVVINMILKALATYRNQNIEDIEVSITFGEYANPSFESKVETVGKAKMQGIMSNEALVDELYGDTREDGWKQEEVDRLNRKDGIEALEEQGVNTDGLEMGDARI